MIGTLVEKRHLGALKALNSDERMSIRYMDREFVKTTID